MGLVRAQASGYRSTKDEKLSNGMEKLSVRLNFFSATYHDLDWIIIGIFGAKMAYAFEAILRRVSNPFIKLDRFRSICKGAFSFQVLLWKNWAIPAQFARELFPSKYRSEKIELFPLNFQGALSFFVDTVTNFSFSLEPALKPMSKTKRYVV